MIYIDKTGRVPKDLSAWQEKHQAALEVLYDDSSVSGNEVWGYMDENRDLYDKKKLKLALIEEQGSICCYCGRRILEEKSHLITIEHLAVKSKNKSLTYDYNNLLASCLGGTRIELHVVERGETLESIALKYGVSVEHLQEAYILTDLDKQRLNRDYIEKVKVGDRIVIVPLATEGQKYCNIRRDDLPIDLHPLQSDISDHFSFDRLDGKIRETKINKLTIKNLGLNDNEILNLDRKRVLESAIELRRKLVASFGRDKVIFNRERQRLIDKFRIIDTATKMYSPFPFVTISILEGR